MNRSKRRKTFYHEENSVREKDRKGRGSLIRIQMSGRKMPVIEGRRNEGKKSVREINFLLKCNQPPEH